MANEPTFNPNAYRDVARGRAAEPRRAGSLRAGLDVQDRHGVGGDRREGDADRRADRHQPRLHPDRQHASSTSTRATTTACCRSRDVIVKSSNVGAIKIGFKVGTERLSRYVSLFGFGRPVSPDFPGGERRHRLEPGEVDRQRAGVGVDGLSGRASRRCRWSAAVSAVANGGEYIEPRVVRAVYRDGRRYAVTPKVVRRTISADTAATLTTIMEDVVDRRHGEARADRRLHDRGEDRDRHRS